MDRGIQNERTALAWQRTALSLMAASAILSRLTITRLGALGLVTMAVAFPLSLWVFLQSRQRYQRDVTSRLWRGRSRGGKSAAALAIATAVIALVELFALLWSAD